MKQQHKILSIILVGGLLTACSSDEPQGNQLPEGQYPLKVSATIGAPQSRSIGKDFWSGDGTETFGVRIGANGRVAKYVITDATGKAEAAPGTTPLYWDNTDKASVSAWLPYDAQTDVDISDQSAGFAAFDYLTATADGQSYLTPVSLQFKHKMAKVSCVLEPGKGVTETDLNATVVKFAGYTSATFSEGILSGNGYGWITPASDREVLLVPQNMTGKDFITIEMGGNEYVYTPENDNAGLLKEGLTHRYTITVNAGGIEVTEATAGAWADGGSENIRSDIAYIPETMKPGDYVYSDGTFSDGGLRKACGNGSLEFTNTDPVAGKTCVGIVFHLRDWSSPSDVSQYSEFGNEEATGYIVSIDQNSSQWANSNTNGDEGTPNGVINGYKYTKEYYAKYNSSHNLYALKWCIDHATLPAASNNMYSAWYLPSQLEYQLMRGTDAAMLNLLETNLQKASGTVFDNNFYFTSGLMGGWGNYLHMYNLKTGDMDAGYYKNAITAIYPYRAVCAFKIN